MKQIKKLEEDKEDNLEQNMLIESAEREERLSKQVTSLEIEISKTKQELKQTYTENDKLAQAHQELTQECEQLKDVLTKQKSEIKMLKERENRLLVDNTELDGENVQLQEQIAKLKEQLVELDTIRHQNKALEEQVETLDSQIYELTTLKRIVERQLEEQLNSIREEREYNYQKKREVDQKRQQMSLNELKHMVTDLGINDSDIDETLTPMGFHTEAGVGVGGGGDSFADEVEKVDKLQELEKKLDDLNKHKDQLENELNEFKDDLNLSLNGVNYINKRLANYARHQSDLAHNHAESSNGELKISII